MDTLGSAADARGDSNRQGGGGEAMTRILVIDDEESILRAFQRAFEAKSGRYEVTCAATGEDGIARLRESEFDLVFIESRLLGVDGMEVLREARRWRPAADPVIMTGEPSIQSAVEAMKAGAVDYVVKPFTVEELDQIVSRLERSRDRRLAAIEERRGILRWSFALRAQHFVLVVTFFLLSLTGVPLLFPETFKGVFFFEDSSMLRGLMHRVSAVVLILLSLFHLGYVIVSEDGNRNLRAILPRLPADLKEAWGRILYNLGLRADPPRAGRYNFIEKFEYFGVVWGTFMMVVSGLVLWFADEVLRIAPLWVVDTAKVVHRYEAVLAILVVAIWHMYTVHLRPGVFPMSQVWWTGRISREEMIEEHPIEYEQRTGRPAGLTGPGGGPAAEAAR